MNNNCVIYPRFSSHGQNEQSIEAQVRICKEYAESKGLNVVNIYPEKARTGTNDNRPAFQKMMRDAQTGAFQYIIVYLMDRFARNRRDSIMYKEMLKEKYGIKVLSALEPITDDEGGEFYEMFLEWNAEKYSKRLSKRVRDGLDTGVANGTFCGGYLIYGYKIELEPISGKAGKYIKRVTVNDEEAQILRYAFEQYDKGVTKKEIAETLNRQGYRMKGKPFTGKSFDKYFVNEKYTGEFTFGGRVCNNMYPQIIDKALFQRVQEKLNANRYVAGGEATAKEPYLLTGKLYCGHCGTEMVADGGTGKQGKQHHYYTCKKRRKHECAKRRENKNALEEYVVSCVVDFLSDEHNAEIAVTDVLNYYEKRTDETNLKAITARIASINKEVEKLTDAFVNAKSTLLQNSIEKKMEECEILLNDLYSQQAKLELEHGYKLTKKDLLDFISLLLKGDRTDKDYQKKIIDNLVSQVFVSDDDTVVYFNIRGGRNVEVENISLEDTQNAVNNIKGVQSQLPLARH
ncbi:MAG: recombinase family protein [Roseburia sp.]|nr:recombinase family protein [Roseburia sp.]